jgi:hypothetical protein
MRSFPLAEYDQRVPIRIGSLSQCFTAQHSAHGESTEVLLKQLLPAFARVPAIATAWLDRAEENSRFDHPGCSKVLDWGEALGEAYLTLSAVPALSLRELLQAASKSGLWPAPEAVVAIAQAVLEALAYVHVGFGLAHLDLDPHAVLLRKDGSLLLTEFGMWRALPPEAATRERFDRGRVAYLCPELTKSLAGDARSDVFSLGAILYELLGRQRPFQGATQLVTAMAIAEGRRRPLHELAPAAPEVLCDIVETMLAQHPDERFQSAQAVLGAFSSCCQGDRQALTSWLESVALRAGPQGGFAREKRGAAPSAAAQVAAATHAQPGESVSLARAPARVDRSASASPLLAPAAGEPSSLSPLPPPLLSPPALASAAGARALQAPAQDDWLAPPPLLSPGRPPAALDGSSGTEEAGAPQVRDGRTAFLDTGAVREELRQASAASSAPSAASSAPSAASHVAPSAPSYVAPSAPSYVAPSAPSYVAPSAPSYVAPSAPADRIGNMVTRDAPAGRQAASAQQPAPLSAPPPAAPPKPLLGSLPPPSMVGSHAEPRASMVGSHAEPRASALPKPMLSSQPPRELEAPQAADKRGWQEPSKTVFQVKAFAKHATRRSDARAPLLVIVLLSVAFGFALVAGAALLWRLFSS